MEKLKGRLRSDGIFEVGAMSERGWDFETLVEMTRHQAISERARALLVAQWPGLLHRLLDAIHTGTDAQKVNLARVIAHIRGAEAVPPLISLLDDPAYQVRSVAAEALGKSRDTRALKPLLALLLDDARRDPYDRMEVAFALGELRNLQAIPALLRVVEEVLDAPDDIQAVQRLIAQQRVRTPDDWRAEVGIRLQLLLSALVALAKLGYQRLSPLVTHLLHFRFSEGEGDYDAASVREAAFSALIYIATPDLLSALKAARRQEPPGDDVIDFSVLNALTYLGLRESVAELIRCFEEGYRPVEALGRIACLVGEVPPDTPAALKAWWQRRASQFAPRVCYRWGLPLNVATLVARLPGDVPLHTSMLFDELTVVTGELFEPDYALPPEQQRYDRVAKARAWARQHGGNFEAGCLYKYGYKQQMPLTC